MHGIKIALQLSRYTRQEMLQALSGTRFSSTEEYKELVAHHVVVVSIPEESSRGLQYKFYRHRKSNGEHVHAMVSVSSYSYCNAISRLLIWLLVQ